MTLCMVGLEQSNKLKKFALLLIVVLQEEDNFSLLLNYFHLIAMTVLLHVQAIQVIRFQL